MNKEEKIVEHRKSGLMFGNLTCICKLIFHIFKNKTVSLVQGFSSSKSYCVILSDAAPVYIWSAGFKHLKSFHWKNYRGEEATQRYVI